MNERTPYRREPGLLDRFRPLIEATRGITLAQILAITGLESSTTQNWIKRGFVPHPVGKKYYERHLARFLLIDALRDGMLLDEIGALLTLVNGDTDDEADDIITESALYELFTELTAAAEGLSPASDELESIVHEAVAKQDVAEANRPRLEAALRAMLLAYSSGWFRKEAGSAFRELETMTKKE